MKGSPPWLPILVGAILVGIAISILDRFIQLLQVLAYISPWLAGIVLCITILGLVILGKRYLPLFQKKTHINPTISENKVEAATENLEALEQQVQQIQDAVTRQALLDRSSGLREEITRQEGQIVVFGVGSAGKTSLVNALLAQEKGVVAPTMGTTEVGTRYRPVRLAGIPDPVALIDCPGLLEVGLVGTEREQIARKIASRADLILFVVDDDLRQTEYLVLQDLIALGKRVLVVFNKIDRITPQDCAAIVAKIQERVANFLPPASILAIAARPASVTLPSGETITPTAQLTPLLQTLQQIFAQEREALIVDNILLQCQTLGEEARSMLSTQRDSAALQIIERYQWIVSGVVAATPLPMVDMLAAAAVHAQMVVELGKVYGCPISLEDGKVLVASLTQTLTGLGITKGALQVITTALTANPIGMLLRSGIGAITAAYLTRIAGKSFQKYFQQQQQWGDGGIAAVVSEQFNLQQREGLLQAFLQETLLQGGLSNQTAKKTESDAPR